MNGLLELGSVVLTTGHHTTPLTKKGDDEVADGSNELVEETSTMELGDQGKLASLRVEVLVVEVHGPAKAADRIEAASLERGGADSVVADATSCDLALVNRAKA